MRSDPGSPRPGELWVLIIPPGGKTFPDLGFMLSLLVIDEHWSDPEYMRCLACRPLRDPEPNVEVWNMKGFPWGQQWKKVV